MWAAAEAHRPKATRAGKEFVAELVNGLYQQEAPALADAIKAHPESLFKVADHAVDSLARRWM